MYEIYVNENEMQSWLSVHEDGQTASEDIPLHGTDTADTPEGRAQLEARLAENGVTPVRWMNR